MRILISGSSGQIGTNLALRCLAEGHEVIGIDCRKNSWRTDFHTVIHDLLKPIPPGMHFWDECPDVVIHLAAHAKVHDLVINPARAFENITMTATILEYCRLYSVPIIFSSSREVYGNQQRESTQESDVDLSQITSAYTASKLAGEALISSYASSYHLPYLIFRLSNVYGRYDNDLERMERVMPLFIRTIQQRKPITIFGREKTLDFTYIDDCIEGIYRGIQQLVQRTTINTTINLAYGEGHTLEDLARVISESLRLPAEIHFKPSQIGEVTHYVANLSRAQKLLDYTPTTPLQDGVRKALMWQRTADIIETQHP